MMKKLEFLQHIRTSSKSRKGFRTFRKSLSISEQTDELLSAYGAYSTTAYTIPKTNIKDYPILFLFYKLPSGSRVICRSVYAGTDLHSYPARAGNYVAHSLVLEDDSLFNPVRLFFSLEEHQEVSDHGWKNKNDIENEDENADAPFEIAPLPFEVKLDEWYSSPFKCLLIGEESEIRKIMFIQAVNYIIDGKKVIIIDKSSSLIHWILALLQAFPLDFIFKKLSVGSFSNSNLLLDICNLLCFEVDIEDRVKRYETENTKIISITREALLADKERIAYEKDSSNLYARTLIKAGLADKISDFRFQIDRSFDQYSPNYTIEEFNGHAEYFDGLFQCADMSSEEFVAFYDKCVISPLKTREIFEQIKSSKKWGKCKLIWECIMKNTTFGSIEKLIDIYLFSNCPDTNTDWLEFEKMVLNKNNFKYEELIRLWNGISIHDKSRSDYIFEKVICLISEEIDIKERKTKINSISNIVKDLNEKNKALLQSILVQIDRIDQLRNANEGVQVSLLKKFLTKATVPETNELIRSFDTITWEVFFMNYRSNEFKESISKLYQMPNLRDKLMPGREMALYILRDEKIQHPEIFIKHFEGLSANEKEQFKRIYVPKDIQAILSLYKPIQSIVELESKLKEDGKVENEEFLLKSLIKYAILNQTTYELWELAQILDSKDKGFPNIIMINEKKLIPLYEALGNNQISLPYKFEFLALKLIDNKKITRIVERKNLLVTSDSLKSIGVLSEIKNIKTILGEERLSRPILEGLVKLPWEHYTWRELYIHLSEDQQWQLPEVIKQQLHFLQEFEKDSNEYEKWNFLACEYILFLIVEDKLEEFILCINHELNLDRNEYSHLKNRLKILVDKGGNECFKTFLNPSNIAELKKNSHIKPHWKGYLTN